MSVAHDPLDFVARALAARGSLSERAGDRLDVVLPAHMADSLGLGESACLGLDAGASDVVFAGFGSPLLERLLAEERGVARLSAATIDDPVVRTPPDAARTFKLVNGLLEATAIGAARTRVVVLGFAWKADCDDIREGLHLISVSEPEGASLPGYISLAASEELTPLHDARLDAASLERVIGLAATKARGELRSSLADFVTAVGRRKRRDRERLAAYFAEARAELRSRATRTGAGSATDKLERLHADEAAKLAEVDDRSRIRLGLGAVAALVLDVPVRTATLRVRRRKRESNLTVRWHPAIAAWEPLACAACAGDATTFALCDDQLHVLCRECYGSDVRIGRADCVRCKRPGGPRADRAPAVERVQLSPSTRSAEPPTAPAPTAAPSLPPHPATIAPPVDSLVQLELPFRDPAELVRAALADGEAYLAIEIARRSGVAVEVVRVVLRREVASGLAVIEGRGRGTRYRRKSTG